jgi:hypothetical protein
MWTEDLERRAALMRERNRGATRSIDPDETITRPSKRPDIDGGVDRLAFERHYRVAELAKLWKFSASTITRLLSSEPGVFRIEGHGGKRKHVILSIPESVVSRVHARLSYMPPTNSLPYVPRPKRWEEFAEYSDIRRGDGKPLKIIRRVPQY